MAASVQARVDGYGFERPEDFDYETYEEFMSRYLSVLVERAKKWEPLMENTLKKSLKVKKYIRKGIPSEHRSTVWMIISGAIDQMSANSGLYKELLAGPKDDKVVEIITTDIHRTFPENIYFADAPEGKRKPLLNVLVAFAHHRKEIGYCQGLNFIVGLLLLIVKDEEKVFWLLDRLVTNILPEGYYSPSLIGFKTDSRVLMHLVKVKCPEVYSVFQKIGVTFDLFTTKWFICCYIDVFPVETVLRIWDCLFYEGSKIIFRVGITLIIKNRQRFAQCTNLANVMDLFKIITEDKANTYCHEFMEEIFKVPGSFPMSLIDKLRIKCNKQVENEERK